MRSTFCGLILLFVCAASLYGQPAATWETLSGAPVVSRYNDVFFATPEIGWVVNGDGQIYRTLDGGGRWELQRARPSSHFRSVAFIDSLRGWVGNVGEGEFGTTDPVPLYQTVNAGNTWAPMTDFDGPTPKGLCGMYVVNDSTVVGVGRVRGPAFFVRTTDGGETWTSKDMSEHAAGLIDVFFTTPDSGFAVGLTHVDHEQSSGIILFTADGGETWEERFRTSRTGEWCWKLSFPSRQVGYASLQRNSRSPIFFLKTSDGGATWEEKLFSSSYYFVQGIGFVTEREGWIGGNSSSPSFRTVDGGETWQPDPIGARMNRFRFLNDSLGYAVGRAVHKYALATSVGIAGADVPSAAVFFSNHPNPFRETTILRYSLAAPAPVRLDVYDVQGRQVRMLVQATQPAGEQAVVWDGANAAGQAMPPGVYFGRLTIGAQTQVRALVLLR